MIAHRYKHRQREECPYIQNIDRLIQIKDIANIDFKSKQRMVITDKKVAKEREREREREWSYDVFRN